MQLKSIFFSLFATTFLITSCNNLNLNSEEINVEIIRNYHISSMSSIGTQFALSLEEEKEGKVLFHLSSDIGTINSTEAEDRTKNVVEEYETVYWVPTIGYATNSGGNYAKYGFIDGVVTIDEKYVGYLLIGIKNYSEDTLSFDYKIEVISKVYDESITLEDIEKISEEEKEKYAKQFS